MLLALRDYIRKNKVVSQEDIARAFNIEATAVDAILSVWVTKGLLTCFRHPVACKTRCIKCNPKSPVFYEYIGGV